jgi:hypothetical protein
MARRPDTSTFINAKRWDRNLKQITAASFRIPHNSAFTIIISFDEVSYIVEKALLYKLRNINWPRTRKTLEKFEYVKLE